MFKKFILILTILTLFTGCDKKINQNDDKERFYLENKYYNKGEFITIDSSKFDDIKDESYVLFTYNNYCAFQVSCEDIFKSFMELYKIDFISIPVDEFKKTSLHDTVKYAPSIILVNKGKIVAYLDADKDEDLDKYQDSEVFAKWMNEYVYFKKK